MPLTTEQILEWAAEDGGNNRPSSQATGLTNAEQEIIDKGREEKRESAQELAEKQRDITVLINQQLVQFPQEWRNKLQRVNEEILAQQSKAITTHDIDTQDYQSIVAGFRKFKDENELTRPAIYPDSPILHYAIITFFMLIESVLNGQFLAVGEERGLVQGMLVALAISMVNIMLSVFIGNMLRLINSPLPMTKFFGSLMFVFWLIVIVFLNLGVGHYREQLDIAQQLVDPLQAHWQVVPHIKEHGILSLENVQAIFLVIVGLVFSSIALHRGYKSDDPCPGYGDMGRIYEKARQEFNSSNATHKERLDNIKTEARNNIYKISSNFMQEFGNIDRNLSSNIERHKQLEDFVGGGYADGINRLIGIYRDKNGSIRATSPPDYFSTHTFHEEIEDYQNGIQLRKQAQECLENIRLFRQDFIQSRDDILQQWQN